MMAGQQIVKVPGNQLNTMCSSTHDGRSTDSEGAWKPTKRIFRGANESLDVESEDLHNIETTDSVFQRWERAKED